MIHLYRLSFFFALSFFVILCSGPVHAQSPSIEYHFPMDGSRYIPAHSVIIVRSAAPIVPSSVSSEAFVVAGSASGVHAGTVRVSDDGRTIIFRPNEPFAPGETVTVHSGDGIATFNGQFCEPVSFSFEISAVTMNREVNNGSPYIEPPSQVNLNSPASLPTDWPMMTVLTDDHPAPGKLFLATFSAATGAGSTNAYRMILDSLANPIYYAKPSRMLDYDFKVLPNGHLAFCEGGYVPGSQAIMDAGTKYYVMDSTYTVIDSFDIRGDSASYATDFHDMQFLNNGHVLMLGVDTLPGWDMSKDIPNGNKKANFVGAVIEELDAKKSPVWVWRSWDPGHFLDTDAENEDLTGAVVDGVHANAIQQDTDGNILLSSRHLDEISKINRTDQAGSFIWRLGGKHNQFKFVNDSIHFSHQHAIRRIANGDLTLFDNGNYTHFASDTSIDSLSDPPNYDTTITKKEFARACEYNLDIPSMTATLAWHFDRDSTMQSTAMGYVQRLDNGNTLISWGLAFSPHTGYVDQPAVTEVTPDEKIVYELHIASPIFSYRAFKFPWNQAQSGVASGVAAAAALKLGEPFPNPSSGVSRVIFGSSTPQEAQLTLYDPLGRAVRNYFSGTIEETAVPIEIETAGLPNGAYQLILRSERGVASRPLVVLR